MYTAPRRWCMSADGDLIRRLDLVENWFLDRINRAGTSPQRETDGITLGLKLKFPDTINDPIPYLQRAWLVLRYIHPLLGALYPPFSDQDNAGQPLITLKPLDPVEWLKISFRVEQGNQAVFSGPDAAVKKFQASATAMAHWFPSSSQLLIRTSHLRFDGVGILKAANTYMLALASVIRLGLDVDIKSYDTDVKQPSLAPGIDHILGLGLEREGEPIPAHIEQVIRGFAQEWHNGMHSISLPLREGSENSPPANTVHLLVTFDEPASVAVKLECTRRGISVSAAVHASIVRVIATFPQHPKAQNILIPLIANLRHLLPPCYNTPEYAASPCCYIIPFCITGGFDQLSQRVHTIYSTNLAKMTTDAAENPVGFLSLLPHYSKREAAILNAKPDPDLPPFRPPNLSSFGVLEKFLAHEYKSGDGSKGICELEDVWIAVEMTDQTPEFQLLAFRNTLRLHLCFNDAYYTKEFMIEILRRVKDDLLKELNIGVSDLEPYIHVEDTTK